MGFDVELAWRLLPSLLRGAGVTLSVLLPCLVFGMLLAIPVAVWRLSPNRLVNGLAWCFSMFFRGVPALILLYMIYNGLATVGLVRNTVLWNVFVDPYYCAAIGFTLNHAGFLVEVVKGGIQAVPAGITDASRALGLSRRQTFFLMTLPMALRYGLSAYMNEVILFAKGTAALGAITVMDLLAVANSAVSTTYDPMTPLVMAAAIYWCIVQVIQRGFARLERHLNRHLQPSPS